MKTVVVIPTYDEIRNVAPMAKAVLGAGVPGLELVFVDDNSPDGTGAAIEELMQADPRLRCRHRPGKEGLGRAYVAGFAKALEMGADLVIQMDCDFSPDPKDLPRLVEAAAGRDWPFRRRRISRAGGVFIRTVTGLPLRDPTGGFKCWRAETLRKIDFPTVGSQGYSFQIEMNHRAWKAGCTIREIPISFTDRVEGYSKITPGIATESVKIALRLRFGK